MNDLIYASTATLAQAIRAKDVSSVELVTACLERIEAVNPQLNAVVQVAADSALEQARAADAALARGEVGGPLHGVPMTIKDSFDTADLVSTWGIQPDERVTCRNKMRPLWPGSRRRGLSCWAKQTPLN